MYARWDTIEVEAPIRLAVCAVSGAIIECDACRVDGYGGIGVAKAADDGR